jgi:cytochrome b pre-mRNA-processing protein 3
MVLAKLRSFFSGSPQKREALALYITLVSQSRNPFFYTDCGVADTLDGRFDVILLHVFLALKNLSEGTRRSKEPALAGSGDDPAGEVARSATGGSVPPTKEFSRLLLECLFDDMDQSLREMGVGDMGVGRRIKAMSKAAFGRLEAYGAAFASDEALAEAMKRNIYRGGEVGPDPLAALVRYARDYNYKSIN